MWESLRCQISQAMVLKPFKFTQVRGLIQQQVRGKRQFT